MNPEKAIDNSALPHTAAETSSRSRLLEIDEESFRANFNRRPFYIRHHLSDHPLFSLPRLIELSRRLPSEFIKYNSGDVSVETGLYKGPHTGLSIEETIWRIENCNSWMVIKFIEHDPEYCELLNQCLDEIQYFSEPLDPGMNKREGFIFISSPSSLTPYHMDPEYNFLLQIRGSKQLHIFDGSDRSVLSEKEIEEFIASDSESNITFKSEYEGKSETFDLTPELGLHIPITTPHWVQNGNEVSISYSVTFQSESSNYRNIVYTANSHLRKWKLNPKPFGDSSLRDSIKFYGLRAIRRAESLFNAPTPKRPKGY